MCLTNATPLSRNGEVNSAGVCGWVVEPYVLVERQGGRGLSSSHPRAGTAQQEAGPYLARGGRVTSR